MNDITNQIFTYDAAKDKIANIVFDMNYAPSGEEYEKSQKTVQKVVMSIFVFTLILAFIINMLFNDFYRTMDLKRTIICLLTSFAVVAIFAVIMLKNSSKIAELFRKEYKSYLQKYGDKQPVDEYFQEISKIINSTDCIIKERTHPNITRITTKYEGENNNIKEIWTEVVCYEGISNNEPEYSIKNIIFYQKA